MLALSWFKVTYRAGERLWRDVYRCVASTYHDLFYYMEEEKVLDPESDIDIFVLHCVFLPQINRALECFSGAWNQHSLRTERMWSPQKIWTNGLQQDTTDDIFTDLDTFGLDPDGPVPEAQQQVVVPDTFCPLDEGDQQRFKDGIAIMQHEQSIQKYCAAKRLLNEIMQDYSTSDSSSD